MARSVFASRNIYVIGAQCTGKTTLVNALEAYFTSQLREGWQDSSRGPCFIREVARTVLAEKGFTRDDITSSPSRALQLQQHILEAQYHAELAATNASAPWYICDRSGLDPIVYAKLFAGEEAAEDMLASSMWEGLEQRMKTGIVILCEAGCEWLIDDGTRLMPTGAEEWLSVDDAFRELLSARGIAYIVIPKDLNSLEERVARVKAALEG